MTAAAALSVKRESRLKEVNKVKINEQLQFKTSEPKPTNFSNILVKADEYCALALGDL